VSAEAPAQFYLQRLIEPLADWLGKADVTDLYINRPGEIWVETLGGEISCQPAPALDGRSLERLARQIAAVTHQGVSRAHPLLAATLPDGSRIQIVLPPATRGDPSISIRRHVVRDLALSDYAGREAVCVAAAAPGSGAPERLLVDMLRSGDELGMLALAVRQRRNILISGGTSTGKTTFLNALLREIPAGERLVLIEDTPELRMSHANAVGLIAVRGDQGEAIVSADDLLTAALRMRPDRIILGELRGPEAFTFLRAVSTGHPGSMTTLHADNPERAMEQLAMLVLQRGVGLSRLDIIDYLRSVIDIYIQVERSSVGRRISEVRLGDHLMRAADSSPPASAALRVIGGE
jgi:type IV secretion system protein VirB11